MQQQHQYPNIAKAALCIAYNNGNINRNRTEANYINELNKFMNENWLERHSTLLTIMIDEWLGSLSEDELQTVCNGEETKVKDLLNAKGAPLDTTHLLNDIFNNVY